MAELRGYLAYGSMKPTDLVSPSGMTNWCPVAEVVAADDLNDEQGLPVDGNWLSHLSHFVSASWAWLFGKPSEAPAVRRRIVRYRDWEKVPPAMRGTHVLGGLMTGFIYNPPRLWAACAQVFSSRIFRRSTDEAGYLKTWPQSMETLCVVLIVFHALVWCLIIVWLTDKAWPVAQEMGKIMLETGREWMNERARAP